MTPDENFEQYWHDHGVRDRIGAMDAAWKEVGKSAYLAATNRTAQGCVEICRIHWGEEVIVKAITERFLKGETR